MAVPIIKRVLTATDFSDSANQALDYAGFFAKTFSVPLDILHVTELLPDMDAADVEADVYFTERRKMAQGLLAELVEHSAATGVVTRFKHRLGIPSQEITKTAAECGVDLIVLGSQGAVGPSRHRTGQHGGSCRSRCVLSRRHGSCVAGIWQVHR